MQTEKGYLQLLLKVTVQVVPLRILTAIPKANDFSREDFQFIPDEYVETISQHLLDRTSDNTQMVNEHIIKCATVSNIKTSCQTQQFLGVHPYPLILHVAHLQKGVPPPLNV